MVIMMLGGGNEMLKVHKDNLVDILRASLGSMHALWDLANNDGVYFEARFAGLNADVIRCESQIWGAVTEFIEGDLEGVWHLVDDLDREVSRFIKDFSPTTRYERTVVTTSKANVLHTMNLIIHRLAIGGV